MAQASVLREIEGAIGRELSNYGLSGTVVLRGTVAELHGQGPVIAVDLGEWVEQWLLLPPEMRDKRVATAVRRLRDARTQVAPIKAEGSPAPKRLLIGAAAFLLLLACAFLVRRWFSQSEIEAKPIADAGTIIVEDRERGVCEAARQRLYAGASMGVAVDGWVVELWLWGADKAEARTDRLAPQVADEVLGKAGPGTLEVVPVQDGVRAGTVARFGGAYVVPFFQVEGRQLFVDYAASVVRTAGVTSAALYARCAHLKVHDVGAWYWGRDDQAAGLALLYAAGLFVQPPAFERTQLAGPSAPLALVDALRELEATQLDQAVAQAGGRLVRQVVAADVSGLGGTALRFGLGGPTRAAKASRALARTLKLGSGNAK